VKTLTGLTEVALTFSITQRSRLKNFYTLHRMNIFILAQDPKESASYHVDKHVVKMPTESGQMLSTALVLNGSEGLWKPCHQKHPCTLWAASSRSNFEYLLELGVALCSEYTLRYGKIHGSLKAIEYAAKRRRRIPKNTLTEFALAMPDEYKIPGNAVESYRRYYRGGKTHIAQWKTEAPYWFFQESSIYLPHETRTTLS
jgi:hypothetical protein